MDGNLQISLDKLPVKRLDSIEENGLEQYPPDSSYEEKRVSLTRRIYFAWALEDDEERERKKKSSKDASATSQWQSMMANLQLAHLDLSDFGYHRPYQQSTGKILQTVCQSFGTTGKQDSTVH